MAISYPIILGLIIALSVLFPSDSPADIMVGGETAYTIQKGDSLILVGSKLGVNWQRIVRENQVDLGKPLKIGLTLKVNTRKIVPRVTESGIVVNIPDRMLYY